jgi:hypothetical protein
MSKVYCLSLNALFPSDSRKVKIRFTLVCEIDDGECTVGISVAGSYTP